MENVKVVIRDIPKGVKYDVYIKRWWGWKWEYGYKPLDGCFFLFDDDLYRLNKQYEDKLIIENNSKFYKRDLNRVPYNTKF